MQGARVPRSSVVLSRTRSPTLLDVSTSNFGTPSTWEIVIAYFDPHGLCRCSSISSRFSFISFFFSLFLFLAISIPTKAETRQMVHLTLKRNTVSLSDRVAGVDWDHRG